MTDTTIIQATEGAPLSVTPEVDLEVTHEVDTPEVQPQEAQGFDIVLNTDETEKDPTKSRQDNSVFAVRRIARKRQRELEQLAQSVQRGELPEELRVTPGLPSQPAVNDFLSESALAEKYEYDTNRALAAFTAAQNEWLMKVQDARSQAITEQSRKTQEFTRLNAGFAEAARAHYDAAEKLNLADYEEKEDRVREILPAGVDAEIMSLFPEKSAAMFYYLGSNPEQLRRILTLSSQQALIELTRLADRLTVKPRSHAISQAPPTDVPVSGEVVAEGQVSLQRQMDAAAYAGDIEKYLKYKRLIQARS